MPTREIKNIVDARPTTDGAGVKIKRLTGFSSEFNMDPFLMLDEIRSQDKDDYIAGFPPHPHPFRVRFASQLPSREILLY